jgi:class I fructose-bisphosphate aldolase
MGRMFGQGFAVIVAMDHGIGGFVEGLEDPRKGLELVAAEHPQGVLLNAGLARRVPEPFSTLGSPCLVIALDQVIHEGSRGAGPAVGHGPQVSIDEALTLGADAVKAMLLVGSRDRSAELANLSYLSRAAEECHRREMPIMIEPYLWGETIPDDAAIRAELGADGARRAIEVGADILKIEYPGDEGVLRQIISASPAPVVILGGLTRPASQVLQDIAASVKAGAVGVVMGRNIWHRASPAAMIRAIRTVAHGGDVDVSSLELGERDEKPAA